MLFLEPLVNVEPTPIADVDAAIERLYEKKDAWLEVGNEARAKLLDACVSTIHASAKRWAEVGASIKGLRAVDDLAGEEWLAGVMPTLRNARLLAIRPGYEFQLGLEAHPMVLLPPADVYAQRGIRKRGSIAHQRKAVRPFRHRDGFGGRQTAHVAPFHPQLASRKRRSFPNARSRPIVPG